jgi:hypothetical protein
VNSKRVYSTSNFLYTTQLHVVHLRVSLYTASSGMDANIKVERMDPCT